MRSAPQAISTDSHSNIPAHSTTAIAVDGQGAPHRDNTEETSYRNSLRRKHRDGEHVALETQTGLKHAIARVAEPRVCIGAIAGKQGKPLAH